MSGKLYLVPTPIGNLKDMTFRAVEILKESDVVLAEDTRNSGILLKHYEISTPMRSYHMHNEHQATEDIIRQLKEGQIISIITDAGTPGISDPGYLLAKECVANNITIECLPGATAFVPALVVSGLPNNEFTFVGFLPVKKGRKTKLDSLLEEKRTMVFYESPHKIGKTLKDLAEAFGAERKASLSREISKKFEETLRGSLTELAEIAEKRNLKGEMVLVVEGV
ncbi:16S rRNA (cytidine1402-2'-O)-methyltransferase [Chishuiella changwenlii]|jgi:16S rRNA (cytidine1402-2'-O)-methyltransferase|uniref:Ribosomal RNA small subunit methyltransferase I n=1 Tax=Chishuiella changwenlii TaxID=1434701 RepID=A0A1M6ZZ49_9FLAO|nr:16S rRNA (cytidine(1402)-2'-O)-methyltransferase [Chishuiella changwenlii]GGE92102.1 ribosomal RNA small subunit methyltransferase I [Chishuiella changwenlii]SHL35808.1 16S rRNA (cytidine1402-2'-O)-methyltransferase [Chishuiella changwenlii]